MERSYSIEEQDAAYRMARRRVSWAALFAGLVIALVVHLMLTLLGMGIGLSTVDPASDGSPGASAFGIGAGIWWVISSAIAVFAGGWVAGRLCGFRKTTEGALHGLVVWGLATIVTFYLLGTAVSTAIGTTTRALGGAVSAAAQGVAAVAPDMRSGSGTGQDDGQSMLQQAQRELKQLLAESDKPALQPERLEQRAEQAVDEAMQQADRAAESPRASDSQIQRAFDTLMQEGREVASALDKDAFASMLASRTDLSEQEARQQIDQWQQEITRLQQEAGQQVDEVQQQAREAAEQAADTSAAMALWGFVAFLIGAIAAAFGGITGARSVPVDTRPATPSTTATGRPVA